MSDYQNDVESRPRDESFDVDPTVIKRGEPEKKNHQEKPGVVLAILGCGVVLTALAVLLYYGLQRSQHMVIPDAGSRMSRETYETVSTEETQMNHSTSVIPEKTRASDHWTTKSEPGKKKTTAREDESPTARRSTSETGKEKTKDDKEDTEPAPEVTETEPAGETSPAESVPEESSSPEVVPSPDTAESTDRNVIRTSSDLSGDYQDVLYEGLVYRVQNREATVVQNACPNTRIEVAPDVYGYPVVGIDDDAFRGSVNASLIVIPEGIDWISSGAFAECPALVQVVIPDSVSGISEDAFGTNLGVTIMSSPGTYAHNFAINKGMNWIEKTGQE